MPLEDWAAVDQYICNLLVPADAELEATLDASRAAGLPEIQVSANQGKFLGILVKATGARRVLELGTLGGYSTIWMARALPADGQLITLEAEAKHAEAARANITRAGLADVVDVRLGPALDILPSLEAEGVGPFDVIFIDADKVNTAEYFQWALRLSRIGTMIIVDNVVRKGAVVDASSSDANVQGIRRFYERLASEPRVTATALQTVGSKGYDGFAIALVTG